ncbi:MAG: hypothetical protein AAF969_01355 [Bacteroidota bacterium]
MLTSFAHPLVCLMLIFSILAPSVVPLVDKDCAVAVLLDTNEEEKSKEKESEKKFNEKDLFLNQYAVNGSVFIQFQESETIEYLLLNSDFQGEIVLPPPQKFI